MTVDTVPIDAIQLDPANLRRHPERNLTAIKGSLARFGQQRPVVVDPRGVVVAGNGTVMAARELGWSEIKIIRTNLEGSEATAFAIADNRTAETAEWDQQSLADVLAALRAEDADLTTAAGFTPDELTQLLGEQQSAGADAQPPAEFKSYDETIPTNCTCPRCGFQWSDGK